jgi:hypothetical protein
MSRKLKKQLKNRPELYGFYVQHGTAVEINENGITIISPGGQYCLGTAMRFNKHNHTTILISYYRMLDEGLTSDEMIMLHLENKMSKQEWLISKIK